MEWCDRLAGVGGGDGMRADLDLDGAVAVGGADEFPVSRRRAIMIGWQKIQVGCPMPVKPLRSSWKPTHGRYGISSPGARSSSFLHSSTTPSSWHNSRQEGSRG
jgi:hypothetical protein